VVEETITEGGAVGDKVKIKIGIDPDIARSGYAEMVNGALTCITTMSFWHLCDLIKEASRISSELVVYIEAGWLHQKSNWHGCHGNVAQKIAKNVGTNHAVGKLFVQYCQRHEIKYQEVLPKGKVDAKVFRSITGWPGRTNQEERDAAMLIF